MEQRMICRDNQKCIYELKEQKYSYYLIIPNSKKVSILIDLDSNINEELIKNKQVFNDLAIVLPILSSDTWNNLQNGDVNSFFEVDTILSNIINIAYQILTYNHVEVDNIIKLNTSIYSKFNQWFSNKYGNRVEIVNINQIKFDSAQISNTIEKEEIVSDDNDKNIDLKKDKEPGFVSYVLLGVFVAVLSLVFLYFIL